MKRRKLSKRKQVLSRSVKMQQLKQTILGLFTDEGFFEASLYYKDYKDIESNHLNLSTQHVFWVLKLIANNQLNNEDIARHTSLIKRRSLKELKEYIKNYG